MATKNYHIELKGHVGGWKFNRDSVDAILARHKGSPVSVLIDSTGGNLATALSISEAFAVHGDVTVHYSGMNASAATVASMGAKHITIDRSAMYLVHKGSVCIFEWDYMNADELEEKIKEFQKTKADLDKIDLNVAALYASRCKRPVKDLLDLMKTGAWLNPQEALEWGFVDEITDYTEDMPAELNQTQASALMAAGLPLPQMPVMPDMWQNLFAKAEKFFSSLFRNVSSQTIAMSKKVFTHICAVLAMKELTLEDGAAKLTEANLQAIDARLEALEASEKEKTQTIEARDKEIADLKAEIEALRKEPAEESHQVVDDKGKGPEADDEFGAFLATTASASKLFNSLP